MRLKVESMMGGLGVDTAWKERRREERERERDAERERERDSQTEADCEYRSLLFGPIQTNDIS